ncbi:MAG: tRNA threonylcarbamoyladenosine dehydratase [Burkholderiaceae bacterium]|nr:tRNA threonylcarbamoyladenosine dehydratase [Burkholderiaceae bacterium]
MPPPDTPRLAAEAAFDAERRFGALARLYGDEGARRIRAAHVAVIGVGGVGSWAAEALARSGVAALTLIDLDHVAESNVNRQVHALTDTLGVAKVEAMRQRIAQIHPGCAVHAVDAFVEPAHWPGLLPAPVDAVIDACDQIAAKTAMAAWAMQSGVVFVTVGAAGGKRHGERVEIADVAHVTHDPLIAQLRYRLRRHHGASTGGQRIGVTAVFSRENVRMPEACAMSDGMDGSLNCHGYGSSVAVTATFGLCAAGWTLEQLVSDVVDRG